MKTKFTLLKKIAFIYCLLVLFNFNSKLYAQIIYTDIDDATPNATYPLDLNNDGIVDFMIQFGLGVICYPQNNNAYAGNFVGGLYLPWALSSSNTICASLATWYDSSNPGTMGLGTSTGYWAGATDKYLALKLIVGSNTYYGWARLDFLAGSGSFTLKDYAYNSTPNACIQAGQTTLRMNENTPKKIISVFPNPFSSSTTIRIIENLKNATLTIYNAYGQLLKQINNISGQTISLSRDNLPNGVYFIRLIEENKINATEKLIITN
jgi:hypothetical protein